MLLPVLIPQPRQQMGTVRTPGWCFNTLFYPLPSSRCLCRPDVLACAAEVLCGLPWGKDSEVRTCRVSTKSGMQRQLSQAFPLPQAQLRCCLQQLLARGSAGKPPSSGCTGGAAGDTGGAAAAGSGEMQEQSGCVSSSCSQSLQTHTFVCL